MCIRDRVTDACKKYGGFYLGSIGGPAAILAQNNIKSIECVEYPELGMEAVSYTHLDVYKRQEYYLLTKDYVSVSEFEGKPILKIEKEGLTAMANTAFRDV